MANADTLTAAPQSVNKFLTFQLGEETYGLPILQVREIIGLMEITRVPRMPPFLLGVVNLRGKVIPVADLRLKFGMAGAEAGRETCIIVVEFAGLTMGLLVDRVSEVQAIDSAQIENTPSLGMKVNTEFILGMAKARDRVIILLDITKVLESAEIVEIFKPDTKETSAASANGSET